MAVVTRNTTYELWRSKDGSYDFFPSTNESARLLLDPDAELITSFEADSWESARQKQHEYLGWEKYKPFTAPEENSLSITDSQGRKTDLRLDSLFRENEVYKLTKATRKQLAWLEQQKIVITKQQGSKNTRAYPFSEILKVQAYVLISQDKSVVIKPGVLKKVLRFYSDNFRNAERYGDFPYSIGTEVKTSKVESMHVEAVKPDFSNTGEFLSQLKYIWQPGGEYTVHVYPQMLSIVMALHRNIQEMYDINIEEFTELLVA